MKRKFNEKHGPRKKGKFDISSKSANMFDDKEGASLVPPEVKAKRSLQRIIEMEEWVRPLVQPNDSLYEGHGVAKPSVYILASSDTFKTQLQQVLDDRGGEFFMFTKPK